MEWYDNHQRKLPWRSENPDPYRIWLSEIILQQTKIAQGTSYYLRFVDAYPDVHALANASEDEILKNWQGLGYYSRARNLHATAKYISKELHGRFPSEYNEIIKLKGVGEYTAAAISSIAFGLPHAVVDGNVYRVLARVFGISTETDSTVGKKEFKILAQSLLAEARPADYNQAVMEFGALQCVPGKPDCSVCPLQEICVAFHEDKVSSYPVKRKKVKQKSRFFHYLVIEQGNRIYLKKRAEKDIWRNLYDFPLVETKKLLDQSRLMKMLEKSGLLKGVESIGPPTACKPHILSHQKIYASFTKIKVSGDTEVLWPHAFPVKKSTLANYAVPKLLENYLVNESDLLHLL